ncbi:hypothetical protein CC80DRAFT_532371 [Byssothecium circinans]|uniref:Ig-like domain-containing protein n=1 Tax=Byssothecium circinans TaxID=147558 RepID=A0A6A5U6M4_9PLEO|nr:hypothetical protein CC80DRAFT_532371 [Byssothecium circinans]
MRSPILALLLLALSAFIPANSITPILFSTPTINGTLVTSIPSIPNVRPNIIVNGITTAGLPGGVYVCEGSTGPATASGAPTPDGGFKTLKVRSLGPDTGGACWLYRGEMCLQENVVRYVREPGVEAGLEDFGVLTCFPDGSGK